VGVDRSSDRPVYKQVADALRAAIRSGALINGQSLPSETQLMRRYGVSRNSVRTAVGLLRLEGLVVTEHGRGSFVRAGHTQRRQRSVGYATVRWQARRSPERTEGAGQASQGEQQLFGAEVMSPPHEVASRLGLSWGERVLVYRHLVLCRGEPVQLAGYIPLRVTPDASDGHTEHRSPGARIRLERVVEELTVRMPSAEEARQLGMGAGVPVVRVLRTLYDAAGCAVEVADVVLAGDRHAVVYEIPAQ
jgi:GntR family transcriptional regulator